VKLTLIFNRISGFCLSRYAVSGFGGGHCQRGFFPTLHARGRTHRYMAEQHSAVRVVRDALLLAKLVVPGHAVPDYEGRDDPGTRGGPQLLMIRAAMSSAVPPIATGIRSSLAHSSLKSGPETNRPRSRTRLYEMDRSPSSPASKPLQPEEPPKEEQLTTDGG
jgi:hypothetical protein